MPVMDGEQMIDHLRADAKTASVPVVVVSTESSDARVERLKAKGARFVHKPFTPEQLRDTILALTGIPNEQTAAAARAGDNLDF
jgi:two-component system chemotaxis response regulator CheY